MERITTEALSVAAFAGYLASLPHETRANVTATERGVPWATVNVSPMTDTLRAVQPCYLETTAIGDQRKRGQCGVSYRAQDATTHLPIVVERARRMARSQ